MQKLLNSKEAVQKSIMVVEPDETYSFLKIYAFGEHSVLSKINPFEIAY